MDEQEFKELKDKFYDQDFYSFKEFIEYMKAIVGEKPAKGLAKTMQNHPNIKKGQQIPKEYLVCALATALDATHHTNPQILNDVRWIMKKMRHYDKQV
jgi:hypothetical protein